MIRIRRPEEPPRALLERGPALVRALLAAYQTDPQGHENGSRTLAFERSVYGEPEVRRRLLTAQHRKCCYCETKIVSESGDIEHFRPKGSVRQDAAQPRRTPGYFWLAYTWDNLLFACSRCNREHKRDLFPLEDPSSRASAMQNEGSTARESPLLVDPSIEDPELHIAFDGERATARNGSRRGGMTVAVLELNNMVLLEARLERLVMLRQQLNVLRLIRAGQISVNSPDVYRHLRRLCRNIVAATLETAPFAGMLRCAVRRWVAPSFTLPCSVEQLVAWALKRV